MTFLRSLFSFRGRVSRKFYWRFTLGYLLVMGLVAVGTVSIYVALRRGPQPLEVRNAMGAIALGIFLVAGIFPLMSAASVLTRRLHDRGRTGAWLLIAVGLVCVQLATFNVTMFLWTWRVGSLYEILTVNLLPVVGTVSMVMTGLFPLAALVPEAAVVRALGYGAGAEWWRLSMNMLGSAPLILFGAWLLMELGFRRGTAGVNAFGPDPLEGDAVAPGTVPPSPGTRWQWAAAAALCGIAGVIILRPWEQVAPLCTADQPAPKYPADAGLREFEDCFLVRGSRVCGPRMVVIPPGKFMMGTEGPPHQPLPKHTPNAQVAPNKEEGERPRHEVTIAYSFAVSKFEITTAQMEACFLDGGCLVPGSYQSRWDEPNEAIDRCDKPAPMNWVKATREYLPWLSRKTGKTYRLLSESEWEYVARAGTTTPYFTGDRITREQANFGEPNGSLMKVGSFPPNAFGLYDTAGNVAEWVQDNAHPFYDGAPADGSTWEDWREKARGQDIYNVLNLLFITRGGSFSSSEREVRAAARDALEARTGAAGLRVATTPP
ncbi:MAG: SUMF1/EgtB/PvdO family nonheme iron enzyme [Hyphomicrobiaceae bacterium]